MLRVLIRGCPEPDVARGGDWPRGEAAYSRNWVVSCGLQKAVEFAGRRRGRRPDFSVRLRGRNERQETPTPRRRGRNSEEVLRAIAPSSFMRPRHANNHRARFK